MPHLLTLSAGTSQPSTTRMLADRIARAALDQLGDTTLGAVEIAPLAVDVARA